MRLVLVVLTSIALMACGQESTPSNDAAAAGAEMPVEGIDRSHKGKPTPDTTFRDPDGGDITLADFRGSPVLVNLWATWCAPCVKELPTLDRLARTRDGSLGVIAVSQDMGPHPSVVAFLDTLKVANLGAYHDPQMALSGALGAQVLPTSILYDAEGRELWRYVGDLDWTGEEAARLLAEARPGAGG